MRALAESHRYEAQCHAQQPDRRELVPTRLQCLLFDEVGECHHRRQGESTVADEVGRHMQFHPPALQGGHQGLDFVCVLDQRVPEQESDSRADDQHHESTERSCFIARFKIQIERGRDPAEEHEHLIQIAHRNMADVGPDQVALVPAHHGADQRHCYGDPRQA